MLLYNANFPWNSTQVKLGPSTVTYVNTALLTPQCPSNKDPRKTCQQQASMSPFYISFGLILLYLGIPIFLYFASVSEPPADELTRRKRVIALVLGSLARSPRMNYHALSLAQGNVEVDLCGYLEEDDRRDLMHEIKDHELIRLHGIPVVKNTYKLPFLIFAVQKVILQHFQLYKLLKSLKGADFLLVQNPPSIPTLGIARFHVLFTSPRTKMIVDWHNLGYSILALKLGNSHPFVWIYRQYEKIFGRRAYVHFAVTVTLAAVLRRDFRMSGRRIIPLHDRPASQFLPLSSPSERIETIKQFDILKDFNDKSDKIVVTSTSYTPDEDLAGLLSAVEIYDKSSKPLPKLHVIITGKGPMKAEIDKQIASMKLFRASISTVWLAAEDYPKLLATADLGVSLHTSSSGWDLPMKIVDMFGCGVPVIALGFPALTELVKPDDNGVIVKDTQELADTLIKAFSNDRYLNTLKAGALREGRIRWDSNWLTKVGPLFGIGDYAPLPDDYESSSSDSD